MTPSATPTPTFPADGFTNIEALNLRAGPHVLHPIEGVVRQRTPMAIQGRDDVAEWYEVRLPDDKEGWVSAAYVRLRRDFETIPTAITPTPPPTRTPTPVPMDPSQPLVAVPPVVAQGDPFLVRVRAEGASQVVAAFDGREAPLFRVDDQRFAGILSAGLETHPGEQPVHLSIIDGGGNVRTEQLWMKIHSGGYPEERIQLPSDRLDLLDQTQSEAELVRLREVWAPSTPEKLWQGAWNAPVTGTVASRFGTLRDYNGGSLFARHDGIDLRGGTGTPVMAPARGRVVFAEAMEVRGNCVWLDHGWGVYSGYFHLSEIGVAPGQELQRGEMLGRVGATGRTTAPHLHWEIRALGAAVHPVQWMLRDVGLVP